MPTTSVPSINVTDPVGVTPEPVMLAVSVTQTPTAAGLGVLLSVMGVWLVATVAPHEKVTIIKDRAKRKLFMCPQTAVCCGIEL